MGNVKFNNISSIDLGLIVQTKPDYNFPSKDVEVTHIPGRNGDLVIDKKSWKNVNRTYSIASVFKRGTDFIANSEKIIGWLTSAEGYTRLEDSYDPDVYRLAQFNSSGSLPNLYDEATVINITFDCKPQRYLKSGEKIYTFTNDDCVIFNATEYESLPVITIEGIQNDYNTVLLLNIEDDKNDKTGAITVSLPEDKHSLTINSMEQTIYDSEENLEKHISLNGKGFPVLKSGNNSIKLTKYENIIEEVKSFDKVIDENGNLEVNKILYLPYNTQIEAKQKKFSIKSFNALKAAKMETYEGESYFSLLYNKSEGYEFISFNQILESYGRKYETTLDSEIIVDSNGQVTRDSPGSFPKDLPEWLVVGIKNKTPIDDTETRFKVNSLRIGVWPWPSDTMINSGEKDMQGDYEFSTFLGERDDRYYAFWYFSNKNPNITFRTSLAKILESGRQPLYLDDEYKPGESISLTFFTAYGDYREYPSRSYEGRPYIDLDYSFITNNNPYWVYFKKNYKYSNSNPLTYCYRCDKSTLDNILYIAQSFGMYYIPKKDGILGMFTKDKWKYCDKQQQFILDELKWNSNKQAFVKSSGLSISTTDSFAYRFCQFNSTGSEPWEKYPQYEDVIEQELDANGNPVRDANGNIKTKIVSKCHFKVTDIHGKNTSYELNPISHGDYLENVTFSSKEEGYYLTENDQTKWKLNQLKFRDGNSTLKVTSGILVNYLENIPTYQDEEGFPEEYIDTTLYASSGDPIDINDTEVYFKSKKVGWYSYIYYDENEGKNQQTNWFKIIDSGNIINFNPIIKSKNNIDLCFITTDNGIVTGDTSFPVVHYKAVIYNEMLYDYETLDNICFKNKNNDDIIDSSQQPEDGVVYTKSSDWLKVTKQHDAESDIDKFIFTLGEGRDHGYFKINSESNWTKYNNHDEPIHSAVVFTEDSVISFIQDMPEYSDFSIPIEADVSYSTTGNPETITITTTESGYYRLESNVNWEYKLAQEVLVETKANNSTTIKYLRRDEDQSSLENVIIKIKPNWWKL